MHTSCITTHDYSLGHEAHAASASCALLGSGPVIKSPSADLGINVMCVVQSCRYLRMSRHHQKIQMIYKRRLTASKRNPTSGKTLGTRSYNEDVMRMVG